MASTPVRAAAAGAASSSSSPRKAPRRARERARHNAAAGSSSSASAEAAAGEDQGEKLPRGPRQRNGAPKQAGASSPPAGARQTTPLAPLPVVEMPGASTGQTGKPATASSSAGPPESAPAKPCRDPRTLLGVPGAAKNGSASEPRVIAKRPLRSGPASTQIAHVEARLRAFAFNEEQNRAQQVFGTGAGQGIAIPDAPRSMKSPAPRSAGVAIGGGVGVAVPGPSNAGGREASPSATPSAGLYIPTKPHEHPAQPRPPGIPRNPPYAEGTLPIPTASRQEEAQLKAAMAPLIKGAPTRARREQANEIIAQDLADATTLLRKLEGAEAAAIAKAEKASGSKPLSDWREAVGRQARDIWDSTRASKADINARRGLMTRVQGAISRRWGAHGLIVAPFGSSITGMYGADSDLDLVLLDPMRPLGVGTPERFVLPSRARNLRLRGNMPDYYDVRVVGHALSAGGFVDVQPVVFAAVPIVKFRDPQTGLQLDLNINDRFGQANSDLLRTYAELRPSLFRPFVSAIKTWAKRRQINDPSGALGSATLSSYSYTLLAIQYLQSTGDLPNLQSPELLKALEVPQERLWKAGKITHRRATAAERERARQLGHARPGDRRVTQPGKIYDVTFARLQKPHAAAPFRAEPKDEHSQNVALGAAIVGFFTWLDQLPRCAVSIAAGKIRPRAPERKSKMASAENGSEAEDAESQEVEALKAEAQEADEVLPNVENAVPDDEAVNAAEQEDLALPARDGDVTMTLDNFEEPDSWRQNQLVIQDPFILDRNCAGGMKAESACDRLYAEVRRARAQMTAAAEAAEPAGAAPVSDVPGPVRRLLGELCADVRLDLAHDFIAGLQQAELALQQNKMPKIPACPRELVELLEQQQRETTPLQHEA